MSFQRKGVSSTDIHVPSNCTVNLIHLLLGLFTTATEGNQSRVESAHAVLQKPALAETGQEYFNWQIKAKCGLINN